MTDFHSFLEQHSIPATSPEELRENIRQLVTELRSFSNPGNQLAHHQIQELLGNLPRLTDEQVISLGHQESLCPICFTPLLALLAEEETALAMDSPAFPVEELGVTKLAQKWQCGHMFCRRDISKWIRDAHDSCPTCRRLLIEPSSIPPSAQAPQPDLQTQGEPPIPIPINLDLDSDNDHDGLLREIEIQMSALYARGSPLGGGRSFPRLGQRVSGASPSAADGDDRHEYVGMYS